MNEEDFDKAHEVLVMYQDAIVALGTVMLKDLTDEQREYIIDKCHDEFRFWRVSDEL
jgi:hypothetical protein